MFDKNWVEKINEIRSDCASVGVPVDVGTDKTPYGIDAKIELGSMPMEKDGDIYDIDFNLNIVLSIQEDKWHVLIQRMQMLTEKMTNDVRYVFNGWERIADESLLIYSATINIKGRINSGLLN